MFINVVCRLTTRVASIKHDLLPSFLWWSGTESTIAGATTGLLYQPRTMDDVECGAVGRMSGKGNRSIGRTADFGRWISVAQWSDATRRS
jgi:hypothetical protein